MRKSGWILSISSIAVLMLAAILPPMAQPDQYHDFADQMPWLGIPNFLNVASNLAISFSGLAGLFLLGRVSPVSQQHHFIHWAERWPYFIFFLAITLTGFGSAYYHWEPNNQTLLWDRLPIGIAVTALLAAVVMERIHLKARLWLLPLFVVCGATSVLYWFWTELQGAGNLNYYLVVQYYSLLLIIVLGWFFPSNYTHGSDINKAIGLYALAKVAETFDQEIYHLSGVVSGHTIKHLLAAVAIYWVVRMLQQRTVNPME